MRSMFQWFWDKFVSSEVRYTDRVDKDDVRVVDFPQHLLNANLRTPSSVQEYVERKCTTLTFCSKLLYVLYVHHNLK